MSRGAISNKYEISPVPFKKILQNRDEIRNKVKGVKENFGDVKKVKKLFKVWESLFEKLL